MANIDVKTSKPSYNIAMKTKMFLKRNATSTTKTSRIRPPLWKIVLCGQIQTAPLHVFCVSKQLTF